jgi:hypothetical protein
MAVDVSDGRGFSTARGHLLSFPACLYVSNRTGDFPQLSTIMEDHQRLSECLISASRLG